MKILKFILIKIGLFNYLKNIKTRFLRKRKLNSKYIFEDRKKDYNKLCYILAGYKSFSYDIVFKRIKEFIPSDIEVCIVSSGKYDNSLSKIAESYNWSYLSVKKNCVTIAQNLVIDIFKNCEYIYKLDEDIFVTKDYFTTLMKTYLDCKKNGYYNVGFVAPLIPINGYGNMYVLKRFNLIDYYTKSFEKPLVAAGRDRKVESDPEVAKFFWGYKKLLPNIDKMNDILQNDCFSYNACPIKFSIGAILFKRELWEKIGMFRVEKGSCMGLDEVQLCNYCMMESKPIIISNNTLVGHLSFGTQNETMQNYFLNNKKLFDINKR